MSLHHAYQLPQARAVNARAVERRAGHSSFIRGVHPEGRHGNLDIVLSREALEAVPRSMTWVYLLEQWRIGDLQTVEGDHRKLLISKSTEARTAAAFDRASLLQDNHWASTPRPEKREHIAESPAALASSGSLSDSGQRSQGTRACPISPMAVARSNTCDHSVAQCHIGSNHPRSGNQTIHRSTVVFISQRCVISGGSCGRSRGKVRSSMVSAKNTSPGLV